MKLNPNRSMLYGVVGGYLLYLAYELAKNMIDDVETTMPRWVGILAVVFFVGIGITLLVTAFRMWKKEKEDKDDHPVDLERQDDDTDSWQNSIKN